MSIYLYNDRNSARWVGWNEPKFATCLQVFFRLCYGIFERMCLLRPDAYQEDDDYMLRSLICQIIFGYASWQEPDIERNLFSQINTEGLENVYNRYDTELNRLCKNFCKSDHTCYSDINEVLDELGYATLEIEENGYVYSDADIKTFGRMFDLNWAIRRADVLDKLRIAFIPFKENVIDYAQSTDYAPYQFFLKSTKCHSLSSLVIGEYFVKNQLGTVYASARDHLIEYAEANVYLYGTCEMPENSVEGFDLAYNTWTDTFYYNDDTAWQTIYNNSFQYYITNKMLNGIEIDRTYHLQDIKHKRWTQRSLFDLDYYSEYIVELDAYGSGLPAEEYSYFLDTATKLVYQYSGGEYIVFRGYDHTVFHYNQNGEEFYGMYKYIDPASDSHNSYFQIIQSSGLPILYLNQDKIFSNGSFSNYSNARYATFSISSSTWHDSYVEVQLYPPSDPTALEQPDTMRMYALPTYIYGTDDDDYETSHYIRGYGATLPSNAIDGDFFRTTDFYIYKYDDSTNQWVKDTDYHFKTVTSVEYQYYSIGRGSLANGTQLSDLANGVYHPYTVLMQKSYNTLQCEFTLTKELKVNDILPAIRYNLGEEKIFLKATVVPAAITVNAVGESSPSGTATIGSKYYQNALKTESQEGDDYNYCSIYEYRSGSWKEVFRVRNRNARNYEVYMYNAWGNHILTTTNSNYRYYLEIAEPGYSSEEWRFEYSIYQNAYPFTTDSFGFKYDDEEGTETTLVVASTDNPREIEMLGDSFIELPYYFHDFHYNMVPNDSYMEPNSYPNGYPLRSVHVFGQSQEPSYSWNITDFLTGFQLVAKALIVDTGDYFMATKKYG